MPSLRVIASLCLFGALLLPSAAIAGGAGDDQYVDPLAGLNGAPAGGSTTPAKHKPTSTSQSGQAASGAVQAPATVVAPAPSNSSPKHAGHKSVGSRVAVPAINVNSLQGIGSLVAVPVRHVSLVLGDIANGRG